MEEVQSILFDKHMYSYGGAVRWMILEGYLKYKAFGITTQYLRFKFLEPDENKYYYRREKVNIGVYYIWQYPKVGLEQ